MEMETRDVKFVTGSQFTEHRVQCEENGVMRVMSKIIGDKQPILRVPNEAIQCVLDDDGLVHVLP